jgi:Protein of unknown function (DUF1579)
MNARWIVASLVTALVMAAPVVMAQADDKKPERKMVRKPAEPVKTEGTAPAMPKPAPELAELKWFAGTWRCEGDVPASPMGPARKGRSTVTIRPDLGGFWYTGSVREDKTPNNANPVQGMFHETYDTAKKQFLLLWVDNYGGWATETSRGWDGDKRVYEGEGVMGGQKMPVRDTFVKKGEGQMSHQAEMKMDGRWTTLGDEVCKKAAGARRAAQ